MNKIERNLLAKIQTFKNKNFSKIISLSIFLKQKLSQFVDEHFASLKIYFTL